MKVDFTDTNDVIAIPESTYECAVFEIKKVSGKESGSGKPYLKWTFKVMEEGECKGRLLWLNTSLQNQALWRLKQILERLRGVKIPKSVFDFNPKDIIGVKCRVIVVISEERNVVTDVFASATPGKEVFKPEEEKDTYIDVEGPGLPF